MEDELASRGSGIYLLGEALEADATLMKCSNGFNEMLQGAAQAVKLPDDQRISVAHELQGFR